MIALDIYFYFMGCMIIGYNGNNIHCFGHFYLFALSFCLPFGQYRTCYCMRCQCSRLLVRVAYLKLCLCIENTIIKKHYAGDRLLQFVTYYQGVLFDFDKSIKPVSY